MSNKENVEIGSGKTNIDSKGQEMSNDWVTPPSVIKLVKKLINVGIDYGFGKTNIDLTNDIRYGVIPQNEVSDMWNENSAPVVIINGDEYDVNYSGDFEYNDGLYEAYSDEHGDIMIVKSPFYTYAQFCSPCAPGACHLSSPLKRRLKNNRCYCFDHEWFDSGIAPYKVYRVCDDTEVKPPEVKK